MGTGVQAGGSKLSIKHMVGEDLTNNGIANNKALVVEFLSTVLDDIRRSALDADVTGILLGTREDGAIRIVAFRRIPPGTAFGLTGTLSPDDQQVLGALMTGPRAYGALYGIAPVGWFRAKPGRDPDLSQWEQAVLNCFFPEPGPVGMVLQPHAMAPSPARFFFRESDGSIGAWYRDFNVPTSPARPILRVDPQAPASVTEAPSDLDDPGLDNSEWPDEPRHPLAPRLRWVALLVAIAALGFGYRRIVSVPEAVRVPPTPPPATPGASVDWQKQLEDQLAAPEQAAKAAVAEAESDDRLEQEIAALQQHMQAEQEQNTRLENLVSELQKGRGAAAVPVQPAAADRRTVRTLKPFALASAPRQNAAAPDLLPPPPVVPRDASPLSLPPPQSMTVTAPGSGGPAPRRSAGAPATLPTKGTLIWTGRLRKNGTVTIEGNSASAGTVTGELPGQPIKFTVYPGDLGDDGITLLTANKQDASVGWDPPGPQNGWNRVIYRLEPRHAADIEVVEPPGPANAWKRLILRGAGSRRSVIFVKWSLAQ
jgi:hypothetical protein